MIPIIDHDPINRRSVAMWDQCGMRFRSNMVERGGLIELHAHSYDHVAMVTGAFRLTMVEPSGAVATTLVSRGLRTILAGWEHSFEYLGTDGIGEVLCFWPIGHDGAK